MRKRAKLREEYPAFYLNELTRPIGPVATAEGYVIAKNVISEALKVDFHIRLDNNVGFLVLTVQGVRTALELLRPTRSWAYKCPRCQKVSHKVWLHDGVRCDSCLPDRLRCHRYSVRHIVRRITTANRLDTKISALRHYYTFVKAAKQAIVRRWPAFKWTDGLKFIHGVSVRD